MVAYREIAMRHGERWLVRKKVGIAQEIRKGKGDATELEAKLAILCNVMEQRQALAARARATIKNLEERQRQLDGKKAGLERQIAESDLMRRKTEVEGRLGEVKGEIDAASQAVVQLGWISKNGLASEKSARDFWERMLQG
jgi:chromosome segregation ATPase